jgi:hypothetical protein
MTISVAAAGAHVLPSRVVRDLGGGDVDAGAAVLDRFIEMAHQKVRATAA